MTKDELLRYRSKLLLDPNYGIVTPADSNVLKYFPFENTQYNYKKNIGSLSNDTWAPLVSSPAVKIINPNPFAKSSYRDGLACWDSAVAIPACSIRQAKVDSINQLAPIRSINDYWKESAAAIKKVGNIGGENKLLRPTAQYIFDLRNISDGYTILEAAHILAHQRGDEDTVTGYKAFDSSTTTRHFKQALAEIIVGLTFDLPIFIEKFEKNINMGRPTLPHGILVTTTDDFINPILKLSCLDKATPEFDATTIVIHVALHIEPHPGGFSDGTNKTKQSDYWCCTPTIINIVGWECIDYLLHTQIIMSANKPYYAIPPIDLLSPSLLPSCLELVNKDIQSPGWVKPHDWITSNDFNAKYRRTPPLPCKGCLMYNKKSEQRPAQPNGLKPKAVKKNTIWYKYAKELNLIFAMIKQASLWRESVVFKSEKQAKLVWRQRIAGYKAKLTDIKKSNLLCSAYRKVNTGKALTKREQQLLLAARKRV